MKNGSKTSQRLKQIIPWLIAGLIFFFLFRKIPPLEVLKTIWAANIPLFIFYSVSYVIVVMLIDCAALQWGISRFSTKVTFGETLIMRGATYLLMMVNYNLGQGGMAFYLKRTHKAPLFKTLGAIFYLTLIDLALLFGAAILAIKMGHMNTSSFVLGPTILKGSSLFFILLLAWILFWKLADHPFIKNCRRFKPLDWLCHRPLFFAFKESSLTDYGIAILLRTPTIFSVLLSFYLWSDAFRSPIPFSSIVLYAPIILLVGTLPITPGGVGMVQALCITLFKDKIAGASPLIANNQYSPEQILFAASLLWGMTNLALKLPIGFYCLSKKSKTLFVEPV